jgi:signal transduction histidine kinase
LGAPLLGFPRLSFFAAQVPAYPAAVQDEIRRQQQIYLVRQVPIVMGVNLANGALVSIMFTLHGEGVVILSWYSILIALTGMQFLGWWRLRALPVPTRVSGRSLRQAGWWSMLLGGLWGATSIVMLTPSMPHQIFLALLIAGMAAGTTSVLNPLPSVAGRFVLASLTPLFIRMLIEGESLHLTVAALAVVFAIALLNGSRRAYIQFADLIAKSHELNEAKADLLDALESTNDAFALLKADGEVSLANKRFREWFPNTERVADTSPATMHREIGARWVQTVVRPTERGGHVAVHTDISGLKEREAEITEAMREAQEANRAKSEFLANMSHELRTPLNAILGFSEMMHSEIFGKLGAEKYKEYTSDIHNSAAHLLSIITDILDLSKIESSKYEIAPEPTDAREVLNWVQSLCSHQTRTAHRKPIEISVSPDFGPVMADARAFKQIVLNLANNALKFTPETGRVGMNAYIAANGDAAINVWDTGIGIPKEKIELVRKPFHQVEGVFQRKFQGTGLGLSISDALIKLHGGRLEIESDMGKGTSVTIFFPQNARIGVRATGPRLALAAGH